MDGTFSVQQAAEHFGVSEKTIRRRTASGELQAFKVPTAQGYEWRIQLDTEAVQAAGHESRHLDNGAVQLDGTTVQVLGHDAVQLDKNDVQAAGHTDTQVDSSEHLMALRALELADRLQRENAQLAHENVQLAGQVGFLQARVQSLEAEIRLLTVEKEPEQPSESIKQDEQPTNQVLSLRGRLLRGMLHRLGIG